MPVGRNVARVGSTTWRPRSRTPPLRPPAGFESPASRPPRATRPRGGIHGHAPRRCDVRAGDRPTGRRDVHDPGVRQATDSTSARSLSGVLLTYELQAFSCPPVTGDGSPITSPRRWSARTRPVTACPQDRPRPSSIAIVIATARPAAESRGIRGVPSQEDVVGPGRPAGGDAVAQGGGICWPRGHLRRTPDVRSGAGLEATSTGFRPSPRGEAP